MSSHAIKPVCAQAVFERLDILVVLCSYQQGLSGFMQQASGVIWRLFESHVFLLHPVQTKPGLFDEELLLGIRSMMVYPAFCSGLLCASHPRGLRHRV